MQRATCLFITCLLIANAQAQKVKEIYFNLYTDSLKKGFYNYISVDGHLANGSWQPLDSATLIFSANTGHFKGNDLFIDSSYTADTVKVKATLRADPKVWKEVVIHIRKRGFEEALKTDEDIRRDMQQKRKSKNEKLISKL